MSWLSEKDEADTISHYHNAAELIVCWSFWVLLPAPHQNSTFLQRQICVCIGQCSARLSADIKQFYCDNRRLALRMLTNPPVPFAVQWFVDSSSSYSGDCDNRWRMRDYDDWFSVLQQQNNYWGRCREEERGSHKRGDLWRVFSRNIEFYIRVLSNLEVK